MKKLVLLLVLVPGIVWGAEYNATTCSYSDVNSALGSASDGDTVNVPAGTCTWSSDLTLDKDVMLMAAGSTQTHITLSNSDINITTDGLNGVVRVSGFDFDGSGGINISDDTESLTSMTCRIDHNRFDQIGTYAVFATGHNGFLYDHNNNEADTSGALIRNYWLEYDNVDAAWSNSTNFGGLDGIVFFEDNRHTYMDTADLTPLSSIDMAGGATRVVYRYNTVKGTYIVSHGTGMDSTLMRGLRQYEIYENTLEGDTYKTSHFVGVFPRGGSGYIWGNTVDDWFTNCFRFDNYRTWVTANNNQWGFADDKLCGDGNPSGVCSDSRSTVCDGDEDCTGTCLYVDDPGGTGDGYPCLDQQGRGADSGLGTAQELIPIYIWDNQRQDGDACSMELFQDGNQYSVTTSTTALPDGSLTMGTDIYWDEVNSEAVGGPAGYTPQQYPHPLIQEQDGVACSAYCGILPEERSMDWEEAGVQGGIPSDYSGIVNVDNYGCVADSPSFNNRSCINSAISAADANSEIVYFPNGKYYIDTGINVSKGNFVLRGNGAENSTISLSGSINDEVISVITPNFSGFYRYTSTNPPEQINNPSKGDVAFTIADSTGWDVGDLVQILWGDTNNNITLGSNKAFRDQYNGEYLSMGQVVEVTNVEAAGDTITISPAVQYSAVSSVNVYVRNVADTSDVIEGMGIEDLTVMREQVGSSYNPIVYFQGTRNCWIKDSQVQDMYGEAIEIDRGMWNTVFRNAVHETASGNYDSGGEAYGVMVYSYGSFNLIENNIIYKLNLPYGAGNTGPGNVWSYNYSFCKMNDSSPSYQGMELSFHSPHDWGNLVEGNWNAGGFKYDSYWGSNAYNTSFRSFAQTKDENDCGDAANTNNFVGWQVQYLSQYGSVIGCVAGTEGIPSGMYHASTGTDCSTSTHTMIRSSNTGDNCNYNSNRDATDQLIAHGNFEYMTDTIHWDETISGTSLKNSYYLSTAPGFFSNNSYTWPWVTPNEPTKLHLLPAKERYDAFAVSDNVEHLFLEVNQSGEVHNLGIFSGCGSF